jgi:phage N-6-adenine-methyltransferase
MRGRAAVFSSSRNGGSDNWQTPEKILEAVRRIAPIALDPCSDRSNSTDASVFWTSKGLTYNWTILYYSGLVYVNPPYSKIAAWTEKIIKEAQEKIPKKREIVLLVPSRTDRPWFQDALDAAQLITFIRRRLRFKTARYDAPFPSALFYFGPRPGHARAAFSHLGKTLLLTRKDKNR